MTDETLDLDALLDLCEAWQAKYEAVPRWRWIKRRNAFAMWLGYVARMEDAARAEFGHG